MLSFNRILFVSGLSAVAAAAFVAVPASASFPPTVLSASCTSQGQICDRYVVLRGPFARGWIHLTAPASHCSTVIYTAEFMGTPRQAPSPSPVLSRVTTSPLAPGQTQRIGADRRARSVRISAQGVPGGCNTGRLGAWSVALRFEPYIG